MGFESSWQDLQRSGRDAFAWEEDRRVCVTTDMHVPGPVGHMSSLGWNACRCWEVRREGRLGKRKKTCRAQAGDFDSESQPGQHSEMQGFMPEEGSSLVDPMPPIEPGVSRFRSANEMQGSESHQGHHNGWSLMGYQATPYRRRALLRKLRVLKSAVVALAEDEAREQESNSTKIHTRKQNRILQPPVGTSKPGREAGSNVAGCPWHGAPPGDAWQADHRMMTSPPTVYR